MRYIDELRDGDRVSEVYLCRSKATAFTKAGKEFENVILIDKTGQIDTKIWDPSSGGISDFEPMDFVFAQGTVINYNGQLQFKIERIRKAEEDEYDPLNYIPGSRFAIDDMYAELLQFVESIQDEYIKTLLKKFFVEDSDFIKKFKASSAAKSVHHGFAGGLLEHSLSVTKLCDGMAKNYDWLNRDLLVSCAMLHDVGKTRELSPFPLNDYTDEGNLLGHIVMGYEMIQEKIKEIPGFPELLASEIGHMILSHHGKMEFGSPKTPAIAEAKALSLADDTDAKMETFREALEAKDEKSWLGFNKWLDSNIRRT
jgi:3'-5' exoribonuclease